LKTHNVLIRQGLRFLRLGLPGILATQTDVLSPRMLRVIEDLAGDWRNLDVRIEGITSEIETLRGAPSSASRPMRWHPVRRDPRAVLGPSRRGLATGTRDARQARRHIEV